MKLKAIIVDIDGTIALLNGRDPYEMETADEDIVNVPVKDVIEMYREKRYNILIVTGRNEINKEQTVKWLQQNGIIFDDIYMRPYDNIETGVKIKEWYVENILQNKYDIQLVLEDVSAAVKMYRGHGYTCWQVNQDPFYTDL